MDEEFKKKAADALKAGADAAKKLGGIACDLGKKGFAAAKEKAKELNEKARAANEKAKAAREEKKAADAKRKAEEELDNAQRVRDYESKCAQERADWERQLAESRRKESEEADLRLKSVARAAKWQGDPEDKKLYLARGWLLAVWWFWNVVYTVACLAWLNGKMNSRSYYNRGGEWIPIATLIGLLIWNRIVYEFAIAFFEMVKHLRQIRDELRRHNMREELRLEKCREGDDGSTAEPDTAE